MGLQITGDINTKINFTDTTDLQFGTDSYYSTIIEYTYTKDQLEDLKRYRAKIDTEDERFELLNNIIEYFETHYTDECTIQVED